MNNRKRKKLRKAKDLYVYFGHMSFREIMESYNWWVHYLKRRDYRTYKKFVRKNGCI